MVYHHFPNQKLAQHHSQTTPWNYVFLLRYCISMYIPLYPDYDMFNHEAWETRSLRHLWELSGWVEHM